MSQFEVHFSGGIMGAADLDAAAALLHDLSRPRLSH